MGLKIVIGLELVLGEHGGRVRRDHGHDGQHGEFVIGLEPFVVRDQPGQHALGVGAAVNGEQDLHGVVPRSVDG
jgi:hypothetical protein